MSQHRTWLYHREFQYKIIANGFPTILTRNATNTSVLGYQNIQNQLFQLSSRHRKTIKLIIDFERALPTIVDKGNHEHDRGEIQLQKTLI